MFCQSLLFFLSFSPWVCGACAYSSTDWWFTEAQVLSWNIIITRVGNTNMNRGHAHTFGHFAAALHTVCMAGAIPSLSRHYYCRINGYCTECVVVLYSSPCVLLCVENIVALLLQRIFCSGVSPGLSASHFVVGLGPACFDLSSSPPPALPRQCRCASVPLSDSNDTH